MSNHEHQHCGCGGHHAEHGSTYHEHGGEHHAHHEHSCCGGQHDENHGHSCCGAQSNEILLTEEDVEFLGVLAQTPFLPMASFILKSSKSSHLGSVALAPVYLKNLNDSMETVKSTGEMLKRLEGYGLITLDYDEPLQNYDYSDYSNAPLYAYFQQTVAEAPKTDEFLFDIAELELGSIALTHRGQQAIQQLDSL